MALEIKQTVKLSQQLVVTPQLQQAIKLLQLSRFELCNMVQKELLENPVLEEEADSPESKADSDGEHTNSNNLEEKAEAAERSHDHSMDEVGSKDGDLKEPANFDWENYIGSYNAPGGSYEGAGSANNDSSEYPSYENTLTETESLQEHLEWQLSLTSISNEEHAIGMEIIWNINDDGYLTVPITDIAEKLSAEVATVEKVLLQIQEFDPSGVGARDLKECLLLQCRHIEEKIRDVIALMIENHLNDLERHRYKPIAKSLNLSVDKVESFAKVIQALDPKPGRPYSQSQAQYITPDVYVRKIGNDYIVTLNEDGLPKLTISPLYRRAMMQGSNVQGQEKEYIQNKLRSALWLIKSIHQRQRTLYKVTRSIVKFQREFFDKGVEELKPMVLKDVAEDVEMHESTISRVTTNKYVHTPRGLFELKYFFNSSIQKTEGQPGIASEAVRRHIYKLINDENAKKPLSDQHIANILKERYQIDVARRTVAKYRESLGILSSSRRRRQ